MNCKKHLNDFSSTIGVCASCLRERLFPLIAAQEQEDRRISESQPPPLAFPRSVSPYVDRRKWDGDVFDHDHLGVHQRLSERQFFSAPQVGHTSDWKKKKKKKKKKKESTFVHFGRLFRSKLDKTTVDDSNIQDSCVWPPPSSSWFATMLSSNRSKSSFFSHHESTTKLNAPRMAHYQDRGMSPARGSDSRLEEELYQEPSSYSSVLSQVHKSSKAEQPAGLSVVGRPSHSVNAPRLKFCLSPLVLASPSKQRAKTESRMN